MTEDIDELELFAYQNTVCAVRTMKSKQMGAEPWYQGIAYVPYNGKDFNTSNWYLKRENAIRMAEVMVRQANRS
jgi:hypothetical protein